MPSHDPIESPPAGPSPSLETILTASPYLFCMMDREGRLLRINAAAEAAFGYALEEAAGHGLTAFTHPDDRRAASNAIIGAQEASHGPIEVRVQCSSGRFRRIQWWFSRDPASNHVLGWGRDVTESSAVREELEVRIGLLQSLIAERTRALAEAHTRLEVGCLVPPIDGASEDRADGPTSDDRILSRLPISVAKQETNH